MTFALSLLGNILCLCSFQVAFRDFKSISDLTWRHIPYAPPQARACVHQRYAWLEHLLEWLMCQVSFANKKLFLQHLFLPSWKVVTPVSP